MDKQAISFKTKGASRTHKLQKLRIHYLTSDYQGFSSATFLFSSNIPGLATVYRELSFCPETKKKVLGTLY